MKQIKQVFVDRNGRMRTVWLLCAAAALYAAVSVGVYWLYWYLYETMMGIWGVTAENIIHAPDAVRFLYRWSNGILQLMQNGLLIVGAALLVRLSGQNGKAEGGLVKQLGIGAAVGAVCVALLWCVLMMLGSVRLGWRITRPQVSINTLALLLTTLCAAAGEGLFFYRGLYGGMKKRLPVWAALCGMMAVNLILALTSGVYHPIRLMNGALSALVCALLADKIGIAATIGFRWGWSWLDQAVFGFAGAQAALYETYPVNLYWLCGGNNGLMSGVLTAVVLCALAAWLMRKEIGEGLSLKRATNK